MVQLNHMHRFKEYLRQRRVDRVVRDGRALDNLRAMRAQDPNDYVLDTEIERLQRRTENDLAYIRKTA